MDPKAGAVGKPGYSSWRPLVWALIGTVLLLPLVGMQLTREVSWTASDFAAAFILLGGAALIFEVVMWKVRETKHRLASAAFLLIVVLFVWAQGAVGIV